MAYSLTLHFTAGDRTVAVLREGYRSGNQVGAKGRHATQTCSLSIRSYEVSAMLLQEEAPLIRAELKDDGVVIFQGVVRPYQSVSAKNNTENLFSLQLMDDTEVLENTAITEAVDFLGKTLAWCVGYLYNLAGIPETLVTPPELNAIDVPFFSLSPEKYAKVSDQLEAMLWEYGYDYKFSGTNCNIVKTWTDGTGLQPVNVRNTLKVQRNDNWSDGVKVNYGVMEICRQIPLAQWKEDVADLQSWRYILPWSYSTSSGHVTRTISYDPFFTGNKPSNFKTEYILGAQNCQARSVQNCTILGIDPHAQSVAVEFSWSNLRQNYVWGNPIADWPHFSIYGDIIYAIPGDYQENITGDKPDEFTLEYIRSKNGAQAFAEREYKRAKCAPVTFSFQALENYEAGSFRRLTDSVTGIDAVIRILSCSMNADGIYSVTAESADYINISVETEELQLRDALDVGTEIILEVSADSVGEGSSVTVTASGRLLDIIESQDSDTFIYRWELNGEAVPAWDDLTEITATFAELGDDDNVFKFSVYHVEGDTQVLLGFALASTLKYIEGKDGDSAEIQYAIGDSITDPPQGDMFWGGEEMLWGQPDMAWDEAEYSDDVPDMERARYIWMRTRVGDNEWQYTRLTGSTSWDPENLGIATTACPTRSKGDLNLVKGDYFVAGAQFTDPVDGNTYEAGYAYTYNGSGWEPLDLTDADSARKASDLLDNLVTANAQIPSSNSQYSVWTWAKNFVAQNAVLNNLFSQAITILSGGHIKGGDRYDASGSIVDWNAKGFYFGSDGKLMGALQSDGDGNTYVGTDVGTDGTSHGQYNTAVGYQTMFSNINGGSYNVGMGYQALYNSSSGFRNVAIGYYAMYSNTTGNNNTALGPEALFSNTTGNYNIALGGGALFTNSTGNYNIGIGADAWSGAGWFQTVIGDRKLILEFKKERTYAEIVDTINGFIGTGVAVGASGRVGGQPIVGIRTQSSSLKIYYINTSGVIAEYVLGASDTTTFSSRTIIEFINPYTRSSSSEQHDCIG